MSVETSLPAGDPASAPDEAPADPVAAIAVTMKSLSEAADQMRLAMTEVLSVTTFCTEVKSSLSSRLGPDLHAPVAAADPVAEQLYRDAHHDLGALSRAGRQTLAAIAGLEQAAALLYQLAARLDAQRAQDADSARRDEATMPGEELSSRDRMPGRP